MDPTQDGLIWVQTATLCALAVFWVQPSTDLYDSWPPHIVVIAMIVVAALCLATTAAVAALNCF